MVTENAFSLSAPDVAEDLPGLYEETFPAVAAFVAKMGGTTDDAKDIFHDAMVVFFEKSITPLNPGAYILGIAKHLWIRKYHRDKHRVGFDELERNISVPEDEKLPISERLFHLLETSGRNCMDLLQAFYYEKLTPERIANVFNYSSAHSATVQKFKCLEKVRNTVKEKSLGYEDFVE
ncbi:MAG TPA: sigma-70 family RNA polymerase sigma factor [Cyclobacteriaceae bacterium]|nr:sigma-70 family RNA polymerase sigma factor [Cyclobacteriaceae bacterium]